MGLSMGEEKKMLELPKIDLSQAGRVGPGTEAWATVQAEVTQALLEYGGFEAVYSGIAHELQDGLLKRALPEAFMDESRFSYAQAMPTNGWLFQMPGIFKSLQINEPDSLTNVEDFARTIWPHGNDFFCNTICHYATHLQGLVQIIYRMILKSLDLEHHFDSVMRSTTNSMRLSHYFDDGTKSSMPPHVDLNYLSIICQHDIAGLEVEAPNGEWIRVAPRKDSFVVLLGECFMAWSNERFRAPRHKVRMDGNKERYSVIFWSVPSRKDDVVKTMDEMVDDKHPLLYKPYKYYDYLDYRFSNRGISDALKSYCGVEQPGAAA